ncbi:MAG: ATP-binding protein [Candidatus Omnitrophica bacterium]|nr:ATP-binding protein [Candidatus Omnitrophota bacterium]
MINRPLELHTLLKLLKANPVVGVLGARQVGKTTLARLLQKQIKSETHYYDLENPEDAAQFHEPMLLLKPLKGVIIIDEIQRIPGLFQILRVLADRKNISSRFLVLGSASPVLLRQSSESLAGRIAYHELKGFSMEEVGIFNHEKLWLRGGFPKSYLLLSLAQSHDWRQNFIKTFLERDLPQLGSQIQSTTLRRFWSMLAHYHGQIWNASEFGRSFGVADTTVRNYLDLFTAALVMRQLQPWHENIRKRQVKSPKVYFVDSGLLHTILNIRTQSDLLGHPKIGASWEGFAIEQIRHHLGANQEECFFWATHSGAELDLFVIRGKKRLGFEIKRTSSPRVTSSMSSALKNLNLKSLDVIHAGDKTFPLAKNIRAVSMQRLTQDIKPLN